MAKQLGRLQSFGFAKETTRGTAISSASEWVAFDDLAFDEKADNVTADQAVGVIENSIGEYRVKNYADGSFKIPLTDTTPGYLFLSLLGTQATATVTSGVYTHTFTVAETAQHQTLTYFLHDPAGGTDYSYANGVLHKMDIDAQLKKFVQLSCSARAEGSFAKRVQPLHHGRKPLHPAVHDLRHRANARRRERDAHRDRHRIVD